MPTTDILLDDNNDLRIENGDFVVGDSTKQHQKLLLMLSKGDTRQFALDGVGPDERDQEAICQRWHDCEKTLCRK
jgi:hypothetical protein